MRVEVLGLPLDILTFSEAVDAIEGLSSGYVVTLNPEMVVRARRQTALREAVQRAALSVADGVGVCWAARLLRGRDVPRVSGMDLLVELLKRGRRTFFLLGTTPERIRAAVTNIQRGFPSARIAGYQDGFFEDAALVAEEIRSSGADCVVVGMGIPKQEVFMSRWLGKDLNAIGIGVGGALDVLAGEQKRAPLWMQNSGTEWLFRLATNPARVKRFASTHPAFVFLTVRERLKAL